MSAKLQSALGRTNVQPRCLFQLLSNNRTSALILTIGENVPFICIRNLTEVWKYGNNLAAILVDSPPLYCECLPDGCPDSTPLGKPWVRLSALQRYCTVTLFYMTFLQVLHSQHRMGCVISQSGVLGEKPEYGAPNPPSRVDSISVWLYLLRVAQKYIDKQT